MEEADREEMKDRNGETVKRRNGDKDKRCFLPGSPVPPFPVSTDSGAFGFERGVERGDPWAAI